MAIKSRDARNIIDVTRVTMQIPQNTRNTRRINEFAICRPAHDKVST